MTHNKEKNPNAKCYSTKSSTTYAISTYVYTNVCDLKCIEIIKGRLFLPYSRDILNSSFDRECSVGNAATIKSLQTS